MNTNHALLSLNLSVLLCLSWIQSATLKHTEVLTTPTPPLSIPIKHSTHSPAKLIETECVSNRVEVKSDRGIPKPIFVPLDLCYTYTVERDIIAKTGYIPAKAPPEDYWTLSDYQWNNWLEYGNIYGYGAWIE